MFDCERLSLGWRRLECFIEFWKDQESTPSFPINANDQRITTHHEQG